jgi:hypothetical protein
MKPIGILWIALATIALTAASTMAADGKLWNYEHVLDSNQKEFTQLCKDEGGKIEPGPKRELATNLLLICRTGGSEIDRADVVAGFKEDRAVTFRMLWHDPQKGIAASLVTKMRETVGKEDNGTKANGCYRVIWIHRGKHPNYFDTVLETCLDSPSTQLLVAKSKTVPVRPLVGQ